MGQGSCATKIGDGAVGPGSAAPEGCPAPCPLAESCDLPSALTRVALLLWKRAYCEDGERFESCQRFRTARRGDPIPRGMLPSGALAAP